MNLPLDKIVSGEYYLIKNQVMGRPTVMQVFARTGGKTDCPFEVTAAKFGISEKEIFSVTDIQDVKLVQLFKELDKTLEKPHEINP